MRILIITPYLPWPINSGGNAAQYSTLAALQGSHEFELVCPVPDAGRLQDAEELERRLPHVRVRAVVVGRPAKAPSIRDRFRAAYDGMECFLGQRARAMRGVVRAIRCFPSWMCGQRESGQQVSEQPALTKAPVNLFGTLPWQFVTEIDRAVRERPDLIQIEFVDVLTIAAWLPDDIPRLFVHHQIHWVFSQRFLESNGETPYGRYVKRVMELQEVALLNRQDAIVTFSEIDAELLRERLDSIPVHVSPFPVPADVGFNRSEGQPFSGTFVFLGSHEHYPNLQGAEWLMSEIWPRVASRCDDARLKVIGKWPEEFVERWSSQRVEFTGFVDDLSSALRGTIMLVPLKIGSGIRTKILVAMAQRVPVVSTGVGCEGLLVSAETDLLVRESSDGFADVAVKLAKDDVLYKQVSDAGYEAVERLYSPEQVRRRRCEIYESVLDGWRMGEQKITSPGLMADLTAN